MERSVGIRELQQNASKVVARAAAGEAVEITDRGRPVARLVPLAGTTLDQLTAAGRLRPRRRALAELPDLVEVAEGAPSASQVLAELRDDDR